MAFPESTAAAAAAALVEAAPRRDLFTPGPGLHPPPCSRRLSAPETPDPAQRSLPPSSCFLRAVGALGQLSCPFLARGRLYSCDLLYKNVLRRSFLRARSSCARGCAQAQARDSARARRAAPERDARACQPDPRVRPGQNRSGRRPVGNTDARARPGALGGAGRGVQISPGGAGRGAPSRSCPESSVQRLRPYLLRGRQLGRRPADPRGRRGRRTGAQGAGAAQPLSAARQPGRLCHLGRHRRARSDRSPAAWPLLFAGAAGASPIGRCKAGAPPGDLARRSRAGCCSDGWQRATSHALCPRSAAGLPAHVGASAGWTRCLTLSPAAPGPAGRFCRRRLRPEVPPFL